MAPESLSPKSFYFGGARSKGFATLRNVSKLQFFDKIGQAKSVGFQLYSAIEGLANCATATQGSLGYEK